jgi:hypothetical protein
MPSLQTSSSSGTSRNRSQSKTAIVPGMLKLYNQSIKFQQDNYQNMLDQYAQEQKNLNAGTNAIAGGYDTGKANVMRMLGQTPSNPWGNAAPAAAQIEQAAANTWGKTQQDLINSGMGSGTILAGERSRVQLDTGQALAGLGANLAQTAAGYEAQFDLAKQSALMTGQGQGATLAGQYLGDLAGFKLTNTVGSLTGQFSQGSGQSQQQSQAQGISTQTPTGGSGMGPMPGMETSGGGNQNSDPYQLQNQGILPGANPGGPGSGAITGQKANIPQTDQQNNSLGAFPYAGSWNEPNGPLNYGAGSMATA